MHYAVGSAVIVRTPVTRMRWMDGPSRPLETAAFPAIFTLLKDQIFLQFLPNSTSLVSRKVSDSGVDESRTRQSDQFVISCADAICSSQCRLAICSSRV